jgi:Tfp pilus assembly protein FimT
MLVVIGIMGLMVAASVPSFARYGMQLRLKTTTRQVVGLLTLARQGAISNAQPRTVVIDPEERLVLIEESLEEDEPKQVKIPPTVSVTASSGGLAEGPWQVAFQPSGSAGRSTTITLSSEGRSQTITVIGATGAVSLRAGSDGAASGQGSGDE